MSSDEDLMRWARSAGKGIKESAVFINLWNDKMRDDPFDDPAPLLQMGYAVFLDKPIIVLADRQAKITSHLSRMADAIEFYDRSYEATVQVAAKTALKRVGMSQ